jgi:hypothetical protein
VVGVTYLRSYSKTGADLEFEPRHATLDPAFLTSAITPEEPLWQNMEAKSKSVRVYYGLSCASAQFICWSPNCEYSKWTLFGDGDLYKGDWVQMKSLGWTLIQYDCCPYKRGKFGHRDLYLGRSYVKWRQPPSIQGERPRTDPSFRELKRNLLAGTLIWVSSLQTCETINFYSLSQLVCGTLLW